MQQIILYYFHQTSFPGPFLILVLRVQRKIPEKGYCGGCFKSENKHKLISQSSLELLTTTRGGQLTMLLYLLTNIELLVGHFLLEDSMQQSPVLCKPAWLQCDSQTNQGKDAAIENRRWFLIECRKTSPSELRLFLVLILVGWRSGASFFKPITFRTLTWKPLYTH